MVSCISFSSQGQNTKAETSLRKAIALDPVFADAHSSLAVLLEQQGNHKEAELSYRSAISLRPYDPNLHNNLAVFLASKGTHIRASMINSAFILVCLYLLPTD